MARCLLFLFILLTATPATAQTLWAEYQRARAEIAVNIFRKACFDMIPTPEERIPYLNEKFARFEDQKKETKFLALFGVEKGRAWAANFKKGNFVIVVSENRDCHVVAHKAESLAVHDNLKLLYYSARDKLANLQVEETESEINARNLSGFTVRSPGGKTLLVVSAFTREEAPDNKPAALISLKVGEE
jgi:hypothetical protein